MATGDLFQDRETGMIKRLVRDDGEKVYVADPGREAEMRSMEKDEFESQFEELEDLDGYRPAASSHAVSVDAARLMTAKREGDEDEFEEAAEDFMLETEASPSEIEETYIEGEPLDQSVEVNGDKEDAFAPDLEAVQDDLPKAPEDEAGTPTEAEAEASGDNGPTEPTALPLSETNTDQE